MLGISVDIQGDKIVISGLNRLVKEVPGAIKSGLGRSVEGVHREGSDFLDGNKSNTGGFPVPNVTGHLRRSLDFLKPGQKKSSGNLSFTAGEFEAVVFNSAAYGQAIHEGLGSSAKFGPRRFITDGWERFNQGGRMEEILNEEVDKALAKGGFQ